MEAVQDNNNHNFKTPSQAGAYKLYAPSLEYISWILSPLKNLMRMYASWSLELINPLKSSLDNSFSLIK